MKKIYILIVSLLFTLITFSQSITNYAGANFAASSGTFTPLSGSTIVPSLIADDVVSGYLPLGFTFYYMGTAYTQVRAGSDGFLFLGATGTTFTNTWVNNLATGVAVTRPVIAPFWDDMDGSAVGAQASYITTGIAGSRIFTFEWLNWAQSTLAASMSFQVKLYESTGIIQFIYRSEAAALISATASIGLSATATGSGNYVSLSDAGAAPTTSTTVETSNISTKPATGQIYTFTPPQAAVAAPISLSFNGVYTAGMNVNWVDNSTNETNFNLFRSTDNINFTYITTIASTSTGATGTPYNYLASGLAAGTTYYWRVVANTEGVPSLPLEGSQATNSCSISGTRAVGPTGFYLTLTQAIGVLKLNGLSGHVILELQAAYTSAGETFPLTIGDISCLSFGSTLTIRPEIGASNLLISSTLAGATLELNNNASYVIIDGRPGGFGGGKELTIENTNTAGSALKFINDANNNNINNCILKGVNTSTTQGVVWFSTTSGTLGNSDNVLLNNEIKDGATTPVNCIYAAGTALVPNIRNSISGNNIYNFFVNTASTVATGILISSGNSNWTINANSFYQTATRTFSTTSTGFIGISIAATAGNDFYLGSNYIGGSAPSAGGTAWTQTGATTHTFIGIRLSVGSTSASSIQGNFIKNIAISTSSTSSINAAISAVAGSINVGTLGSNTIGDTLAIGNITWVGAGANAQFTGILSGTGAAATINIANNTIGGIAVSGAGTTILRGIYIQSATGSFTVSNNYIGSGTNANNISNSTNTTLIGIAGASTLTTSAQTISNNIISNLTSSSSGTAAQVVGILQSSSGIYNSTGNSIYNLTSSAPNVGTGSTASVIGISHTAATTAGHAITQNTIYGLSNTSVAASSITLAGIYYNGTASGTNVVSRNLIHTLNLSATGAVPIIYGINVAGGTTSYANNMVDLGNTVSSNASIFGINDGVGSNNYFYNSVYLGGASGSTLNSFSFNSSVTVNNRLFQNNIFVNARTNSSTGKNYAVQVAGSTPNPTGLTINYNDYFVTGTGTVFGKFNNADVADLAAWRTAVGQDLNSISADPLFVNPTLASPDLHVQAGTPVANKALFIASITTDFDLQLRGTGVAPDPTAPWIGADEILSAVPVTIEYFQGAKQTTGNLLDWKVSVTSSSFATLTLERSQDGRSFSGINSQQATSLRCQSPFSYVDAAPLPGVNYYRLKMTDADGKTTYSHLVVIINKEKGFEIVGLNPNPVYNVANLNLSTATASKIEVLITDINGRLMLKQTAQLQSGSNLVPLKVASLAPGSYQVTVINDDGEKTSIRFVKQ